MKDADRFMIENVILVESWFVIVIVIGSALGREYYLFQLNKITVVLILMENFIFVPENVVSVVE